MDGPLREIERQLIADPENIDAEERARILLRRFMGGARDELKTFADSFGKENLLRTITYILDDLESPQNGINRPEQNNLSWNREVFRPSRPQSFPRSFPRSGFSFETRLRRRIFEQKFRRHLLEGNQSIFPFVASMRSNYIITDLHLRAGSQISRNEVRRFLDNLKITVVIENDQAYTLALPNLYLNSHHICYRLKDVIVGAGQSIKFLLETLDQKPFLENNYTTIGLDTFRDEPIS